MLKFQNIVLCDINKKIADLGGNSNHTKIDTLQGGLLNLSCRDDLYGRKRKKKSIKKG